MSAELALLVLERCPIEECGARLRVRHNRTSGEPFLGCSAWPRCHFTEPLEERTARMAERIAELEAALDEYALARPTAPAEVLEKEIAALVFQFHPDRRSEPVNPTEITRELLRLREAIRAAA